MIGTVDILRDPHPAEMKFLLQALQDSEQPWLGMNVMMGIQMTDRHSAVEGSLYLRRPLRKQTFSYAAR